MVLRKYIGELNRCLSSQDQLLSVAINLYAKALISEEVRDMVISGGDGNYAKAAKLLSAVEKQVTTSHALAGFLEVLKNSEIACQSLVDQIIRDENLHINADGHIVRQNSLVRQGSSQDSGYDHTEYPPHHNQLDTLLSTLQEQPIQNTQQRHRSSSYPSAQPTANNQQQLPTSQQQLATPQHTYLPHGTPVTTASQPQNISPPPPHNVAVVSPLSTTPPPAATVISPPPAATVISPPATVTSTHLQQPLASPSVPSTGPSNLQLMCEVQNASTGAVITGTSKTIIYRDITIKKKRCSVSPYTPLRMRVQANQRSYIYIINIGSSGKVTTLIPNEYEPRHLVEPGTTLECPPRDAEYEFELDGQSGEEIIVVLAYSAPCETHQADCSKLRARDNTPVYRDVTIKRKPQAPEPPTCELSCNAPLGFLELHFTHR